MSDKKKKVRVEVDRKYVILVRIIFLCLAAFYASELYEAIISGSIKYKRSVYYADQFYYYYFLFDDFLVFGFLIWGTIWVLKGKK